MATPRLTARPPSPFVPAGKSGLCCKCHVARVYALMVFVSLLALLLFLFVPWAASHGAIRATAGDAVAVAEAGTGGRVRGRGRGPQLERGDSLHFGGNGGIAESAMRMGGEQADVIREKAVTMADAADAVASSEAAFKGDEALAGSAGAAEEMEEGAERGTDGGEAEGKGEGGQGGEGGEGEEGGGGAGGEVPMPLRVYMLPLTGELNFHVLLSPCRPMPCATVSAHHTHLLPFSRAHPPPTRCLPSPPSLPTPRQQQRWRFANREQLQLQHGMPADWRFKGNSLRPRADGDVLGFMVQDDGWVEDGQGEGGGGGGGGGGERSVQVPQFVEGFGVHIEQYAAEYWLTLSLLAGGLPSVQRVRRAEDAHIVFVPAFSSAFYATQMKTEEQHLLAAVTQHALWGDGGGQGGGASQGAEGQPGEGELLEKVEVSTGEGSPGGGGGGGAGEAGGSSRRRLLRVLKGGRKGKEAEAGEQAQNAPVEGQQGPPDGGAGEAERADAAERSQSEGGKGGLVPREQVAHLDKDVLVPYSALIPPFLNDSLPGETEGGHGSVGAAQAVAAWGRTAHSDILQRHAQPATGVHASCREGCNAGRTSLPQPVPLIPSLEPLTHPARALPLQSGLLPLGLSPTSSPALHQGGAMRVQLARLLANVSGADIAEGRRCREGCRRPQQACAPPSDTASSCRLFDAVLSHCIPLVVSDSLDLPFEEALDYTAFALFLPQALALRPGYVEAFLRNVSHESAFAMWQRLREVCGRGGTPLCLLHAAQARRGGGHDLAGCSAAVGRGPLRAALQPEEPKEAEEGDGAAVGSEKGLSAAHIVVRPRALPLM
ncbi:unnamed protein product [Closterium sp. Naga37s-1]|nr:unnamed protein product [Closterium sp. Naga37s-1]